MTKELPIRLDRPLVWLAYLAGALSLQGQTLFEENFDSVTLGPNVDEGVATDAGWTASPPTGWTVDNSNMPMVDGEVAGTTEWRGWTFADPAWWASVDDQRRSEFSKASGAAAIADPDEWDDVGDPADLGNFESYLVSPNIDVSSVAGDTARLTFDFSWRPEGNQTGNVSVVFDGGEPQEIFRLDTASTTDNMTNESASVDFAVPVGTSEISLRFGMFDAGNNWFWAVDNVVVKRAVLFAENFDSVELGPNVDEGVATDAGWTATPPVGWTVDNSNMPMVDGEVAGTTEWRGWTFADPAWWASVDDQRRSEFTKAGGAAAIADPDEWDDVGDPADLGNFESYLISPNIDVSSAAGGSVDLSFDFSWRPEGEQTANVSVIFDGGEPQEIFRLDTASTTDDMTNESAEVSFVIPGGASEVSLRFGMFNAGNNWFWAVDNVLLKRSGNFSENFESVELGPNVDEGVASDAAWTATPPAGWTVDNSNMPMVDGEVAGTTEWRGWTFADAAWWASVDDQRRSEFTKASGVAAVADPDEWDDVGDPADLGNFESYLVSPDIDVSPFAGGFAALTFDFSWRPEGNQTGNVTLAFDGGESTEIFRLDTASTTDDMTNESAFLSFAVPEGAQNARLRFGMFDAGNNWFWAIDNIGVGPTDPPVYPSNLTGVGIYALKQVTLNWEPAANVVGSLELLRDDEVIAELAIEASEYVDQDPPGVDVTFTYTLRVNAGGTEVEPLTVEVPYNRPPEIELFSEDFNSVVLGESVDEGAFGEEVWSAEPPAGWTVDNSKMPMLDGELLGVTEWRGWTFADPEFWASVDNQRRSEFINGDGVIAVADPDEWDDIGGPSQVGTFESYLISPAFDVSEVAGLPVTVVFDSGWRPEGNQTGNVTVAFDGGEPVEILRLDSATTQDNETNEVKIAIANVPAGAQEMTVTFGMFDAGNNWFWVIDNLVVTTKPFAICPTGLAASTNNATKTVTLNWVKGANLGDATLQVWRNGAMVAENLPFDTETFEETVEVPNPDEAFVMDYEVRVVGGPEPCQPLTITAVITTPVINKLAQWDFEEAGGSTVTSSLGDGLEGELLDLGDESWVNPDFLGGAIEFQGDGYVDFGTSEEDDDERAKSALLRPLAGLTISAWVNPADFVNWAGIAGTVFDSGSNEGGFYLNTRDNPSDFSFALATESDGQLTYLRAEGVPGEWQHVVGTYDGSEQRLYLNGELVANRPASGLIDYDPQPYGFQIGTFIDDNEDVRFSGLITQVAIWDGALTGEEINLLYEIGRGGENIDPALDSDADGLIDTWEITHFGSIEAQSALDDPDEDQLNNLGENRADTDPNKGDTDDDGVDDSTEVAFGSDPSDGGSKPGDDAVALFESNNTTQDWNTPEVWSNGEAPSAGKPYFANGAFAASLRTPTGADANFAGDSLELFEGAQLWVQSPSASVGDLVLKSGRLVQGGNAGSTVRLGGSGDQIQVVEPSFMFFNENNSTLEIGSKLVGDQLLSLSLSSPFGGKAIEGGTLALLGDNSGFTGGWEVSGIVLKVGHRSGLGGSDVVLNEATLDPDVAVDASGQNLTLNGALVKLVLDHDVAFASVSVGDQFDFPEGIYTAADLLGLGFSEDNVVDGGGKLYVNVPLPDPGPEEGEFEITEISSTDAGVVVTWTSEEGQSYAIETSEDGQSWEATLTGIAGGAETSTAEVERDGLLQLIRVLEE